jgi:hypothetical protein
VGESGEVTLAAIVALIDTFVSGDDRSLAQAQAIEVALDDAHPGDESVVGDAVIALAQYAPGGGEFLYDETHIVGVLSRLKRWLLDTRS